MDKSIETIKKDLELDIEITTGINLRKIEALPFGIRSIDRITGGGAPRGLTTEIYGNPSCGKSSLCLQLIANSQKAGVKCLYIDAEMAMTTALMEKMGVDTENIVIARPISGEDAFELIDAFSEKGYGLIVVDSVSSLAPTAELETDYNQDTVALQARMMSKGLRKISGILHKTNTAVVFINQIREKMARMPAAKTTTTSGGRALGFYAGLRLEVARIGWVDKNIGKNKIREGMRIKVHAEKNKLNTPQLSTEIEFMFEDGFNIGADLLEELEKDKTIEKVGMTYLEDGTPIGQKKDAIDYVIKKYSIVDKKSLTANNKKS